MLNLKLVCTGINIFTIIVDENSKRRPTTGFCVKHSQFCCSTFIVDLLLDSV